MNETDVFSRIVPTIYQLAARDVFSYALGPFEGTGILGIAMTTQDLQKIKTRADLDVFFATLPDEEELADRAKGIIRAEFQTIEDRVRRVEEDIQVEVRATPVDYPRLAQELLQDLGKREELQWKKQQVVRGEKDFTDLTKQLENAVIGRYRKLFEDTRAGFRIGDEVEIVAMAGFDTDNPFEQGYYHGGNAEDMPLHSTGAVTKLASDERILIAVERDGMKQEWSLHPDEMAGLGRNRFTAILEANKGDWRLIGQQIVADAQERSEHKLREYTEGKIRVKYEGIQREITGRLQQKFGLDDEDLRALGQGKDFDYAVPFGKARQAEIPFQGLAALALMAISYKGRKAVDHATLLGEKEAMTEQDFQDAVLAGIQLMRTGEEAIAFGKEQMDTLANLLEKEYALLTTRHAQQGEIAKGVLAETVKSWLDRKKGVGKLGITYSFQRALLYNDRGIYTANPFAPPAEELHRVIKLEVGNGCNYAKCTYCTEYAGAPFFLRDPEDFEKHAREVRDMLGDDLKNIQRVFLAGGNIFGLPIQKLLRYVNIARALFHGRTVREDGREGYRDYTTTDIRRIAAFTRTEGILEKKVSELNELFDRGLNLVFWGIETGSDAVLQYVHKNITAQQMLEAGEKVRQSKMKVSVMIMPGLGGLKHYESHVTETARLLNTIKPRYITFLTVNPKAGSLYDRIMRKEVERDENQPLNDEMVVEQMYDMVSLLENNERRNCLVAAYRLPVERVANNPLEFRGRMENGEKPSMLKALEGYFTDGRMPSPLLPDTAYNKGSPLRRKARELAANAA